MELLPLIAVVSLSMSVGCDFWFNRIVMTASPNGDDLKAGKEDTVMDLVTLYRARRPAILVKTPVLDAMVENGGRTFFFVFAIAAISLVFRETRSFGWVLAVIPGLILMFFLCNQAAVFAASRFPIGKGRHRQ
jgi:hypothetical protein